MRLPARLAAHCVLGASLTLSPHASVALDPSRHGSPPASPKTPSENSNAAARPGYVDRDVRLSQPGASAILSTLQNAARKVVYADQYVSPQVALDTLNANPDGGQLVFPCGRFEVPPGGWTWGNRDKISIRGQGQCTVFVISSRVCNLFKFTASSKISIEDFWVEAASECTSGRLFDFQGGSNNVVLSRVFSDRGYDIAAFGGSGGQIWILNSVFNNFTHDGIDFQAPFKGQAFVDNVTMNLIAKGAGANKGSGLRIQSGDTFYISNTGITSAFQPIIVRPLSNSFYGAVANAWFTNVFADGVGRTTEANGGDGGGPGWTFDGTVPGASIKRIHCVNCWGAINVGPGFRIQGVEGFVGTNLLAVNNQGAGIELLGSPTPSHVRITASQISGNSFNDCGRKDGIYVGDHTAHIIIANNHIGSTPSIAPCQRYGINNDGENIDFLIITGNDTTGNKIGGIKSFDGPSKKRIIKDNF